jgi:DNA invertase Pin-like site-specific DNA recombinase
MTSSPTRAFSYLGMSTDVQLKGDSRRRQLEASREYADRHGLVLVEEDQLEDIGVSAFDGTNIRGGPLGRFLTAVNEGKVAPGSYFLVESLDRLSRQQILEAQRVFLSIVQAGINLVTLSDGRVYSKDTTELADLIMALLIMSRANEESQIKKQRLESAWKKKRILAPKRPMTAICPAWLRLSHDRSKFEIVPERARVVESIFRKAASGLGMYAITAALNKDNVAPFGRANGWHKSYVAKILNNRAVLGEFQPHVKVDMKRHPDGVPVTGYFPAVVSEELFYNATAGRVSRTKSGRGRKGPAVSNLFSGLLRCAYCNHRMRFENKGQPPKGGRYIVCDQAMRHLACVRARWRYDDFEKSFIAFVSEIDFDSILAAREDTHGRRELEGEIDALRGKIAEIQRLQEKTLALYHVDGEIAFVHRKLKQYESELAALQSAVVTKQKELESLTYETISFNQSRADIGEIVEQVRAGGSDGYSRRAMLSARLHSLLLRIEVAPLGKKPILHGRIEVQRKLGASHSHIKRLEETAGQPEHTHPYYKVFFRGGGLRKVAVSPSKPAKAPRASCR